MQVSCVIVFPIRLLLQNGFCFFLARVETLLYIVDHYETVIFWIYCFRKSEFKSLDFLINNILLL